jgi:minor fimbrial subunit
MRAAQIFRHVIRLATWSSLLLSTVVLASAPAGNVTITANVVASPCIIASDTLKKDVVLGHFFTSSLKHAADVTDWVPFTLNLEGCPATTTQVVVYFKGEPDTIEPSFFRNVGSSEHIAIEVNDSLGVLVSNGTSLTVDVDKNQHTAKVDLMGRMITPEGNASAGTVKGILELSFNFK